MSIGGTMKSIKDTCDILKETLSFSIISSNYDFYGKKINEKKHLKGVNYLNKSKVSTFISELKDSKLIWINSLYNLPYALTPILSLFFVKKTTVLISPRGQLLQGAISTKKIIYLQVLKLILKLTKHTILIHFTHKNELEKSYPVFKNFQKIIFPNPINGTLTTTTLEFNSKKEYTIACFGRVAPIKNIEFAIELLPLLPEHIGLQIHGCNINKKYNSKLISLINKFGLKDRVNFYGDYDLNNLNEKIKDVDLVLIPSHSENFCHGFFEAIEAGKMVIASDGLPWEKVNEVVANTILPLESNLWVDRIKSILLMDNPSYNIELEKLKEFYNKTQQIVNKEIEHNFNSLIN